MSRLRLHLLLLRKHFRRHSTRILLTAIGIGVGVATAVAIVTINRSTYHSFASSIERIAGRAEIEITNGKVGVPDSLVNEVEGVLGVEAAAGVVQEFVRVPRLDGRQIAIFGVDLLQRSPIWEDDMYEDGFKIRRELDVVTDARAVLLSDKLMTELGLEDGDKIEVAGPTGRLELNVRGSFHSQRFANIFQNDVGLMDILPAQITFGMEGALDSVSIAVLDGYERDDVVGRLEKIVAGRGELASPAVRGQRIDAMLATNRWLLTLSSIFSLAVALFLIAHSMYTSTEQREPVLATLRCIGAARSDLAIAVLGEAVIVASIGTVVGIAGGVGLCAAAAGPFGMFVTALYEFVAPDQIVILPRDIALAVAIAFGATLAGVAAPMLRASSTAPLRRLARYNRANEMGPTAAVVGSALLLLGLALPSLRFPREWFLVQTVQGVGALVLLLMGATLLAPRIVGAMGGSLAWIQEIGRAHV